MKNAEIAKLFDRTADVMAVLGANSFKILAYRKIVRTLEELGQDVETLAASDALENVPGIGESSAEKIREYLRTGHISEFEEVWKEVPPGVMEIMKIPSVGPKTAALLWQEGGITSVEALQARLDAADLGGLTKIPTLGEKKLLKIKQNLAFLATSSGRVRLGDAMPVALELVEFLRHTPGVEAAQYCGSLRRGRETIGDIDIAVAADQQHAKAIGHAVTSHPQCAEVIGAGATKTSIRTVAGMQVDVRIVPPESFGAAVQYFTGSKDHNVKLREIAIKQGCKLNEWGLFKGDKAVAGRTEEEIYDTLGMVCLPPEMREDRGEIELAQEMWQKRAENAKHETRNSKAKDGAEPGVKTVPAAWETLELADLRGDLHMHTIASDGTRTIEDMVGECKRRGRSYCAITDHSKSQFQANGLSVDRLMDHVRAIHAVANEAWRDGKGILVLAGAEVDILADGSLDYEDDVLAKLDWVVASPHAALSQESEPATTRLVKAISNPYVHVIGHPTGRLVGTRKGLEPDMHTVVFAAARHGVALELNANTYRLDLRDTHLRMAADASVMICINTDAHAFDDMDQMTYGVMTARRGWLRKENVLNTLPVEGFRKWIKNRKEAAGW